jgi:hypothetical protein
MKKESCKTLPEAIKPEDGNCNLCWNNRNSWWSSLLSSECRSYALNSKQEFQNLLWKWNGSLRPSGAWRLVGSAHSTAPYPVNAGCKILSSVGSTLSGHAPGNRLSSHSPLWEQRLSRDLKLLTIINLEVDWTDPTW